MIGLLDHTKPHLGPYLRVKYPPGGHNSLKNDPNDKKNVFIESATSILVYDPGSPGQQHFFDFPVLI